MTSIRIEAENMTLAGGYQIESGSFASGGKYIGLSSTLGTTGTASRSLQDSFALPSGIYNVTVAYFDETDGQSPLSLSIAGVEKASWIANQSLVGTRAAATNLTTKTIENVQVNSGDEVKLAGSIHSGENARFDFIEFVSVTPPNTDTTAPTASSFTPSDNATGVAVDANLVVNFNEDIKKGSSGNIVIKKLSDNSVVETISVTASNITVSGSQLTINPTADLASNTDYYVEIANAAIEDIAGNDYVGITGNSAWNFTTVADTTAPTASSFTPSDNATGVAVGANLVVNFNENIKKGTTGNIVIKKLSDNSVVETIVVTASNITVSGSQLTINPTADLAFNTDYYVEIANGAIEDIAGNDYTGIRGNSTWNFKTANNTTPPAKVTIEAENMTLTGYNIESGTFASAGAYIGLTTTHPTGTAIQAFTGQSGVYDINVKYFDESDGASLFSISTGGNTLKQWFGSQSPGDGRATAKNLLTQTISGVYLNNGDELKLSGILHSGENARFDSIELVPVSTPAPNRTSTANYSQASKGVYVNLQQNAGYIPNLSQTLKLMPLGDSITAGKENDIQLKADWVGYRKELWKDFQFFNLPVDFVGSQSNGNFSQNQHEGYSGWTISQITGGANNWITATNPDMVLLMIGTNDASSSGSTMASSLETLVNRITGISKFDNGDLLVSTIAPIHAQSKYYGTRMQNVKDYNALIPGVVNNQPASENVKFVNMWEGLNPLSENDISSPTIDANALHPTQAGYQKMAYHWFDSILSTTQQKNDLTGKNNVVGSTRNDMIFGNASNNNLEGGAGDDEITGGEGADTFVYNNPNHGQDILTDFNPSFGDNFSISAAGFGAGLVAGTALSTTASDTGVFVSGNTLNYLGNMPHFFYNTATGVLGFDPDGNNAKPLTLLATLTTKPVLSANQFTMV
ncbi:MAG: Ig-like domain-containing protein [Planktothrix sp.]|uniref:Ig-like domain-containing protein n=1 Tax=Planktothrix sp. TaxID=3088171 RepID=UPI0038D3E674